MYDDAGELLLTQSQSNIMRRQIYIAYQNYSNRDDKSINHLDRKLFSNFTH